MTNITRACTVYCEGPLLMSVQLSGIFNDSKTFVDMPMKYDPEEIMDAFYNLSSPNDPAVLLQFVDDHFLPPAGSDLTEWVPSDFTDNPSFLSRMTKEDYKAWASDLNQLWLVLGRAVNASVLEYPQRHSFVPRNYPMIVPGGRFRESYYWDSWWIIRGLLVCDMSSTALDVINNLLDDVVNFGFVPNGGRIYYLDRSQPPLLSAMVMSYLEYMDSDSGDDGLDQTTIDFMIHAYDTMQKEYAWWMDPSNGHVSYVSSSSGSDDETLTYTLNHYFSNFTTPRPESYLEDYTNAQFFSSVEGQQYFYHSVRSGAETGWDFSSRWIAPTVNETALVVEGGNTNTFLLKDIKAEQILPADLNAILYQYALNLVAISARCAQYAESIGDTANYTAYTEQGAAYQTDADNRRTAIHQVLWDPERYHWRDFNVTSGKFSNNSISIASWIPIWGGDGISLVPDADSNSKDKLVESLINSDLLQAAGVLTTRSETGQQWDSPNAWAPLVMFTIEGLNELNTDAASNLSNTVANRWLNTNYLAYNATGYMYEKYNSFEVGVGGGGGEYIPQIGFGWSNGVALVLLDQLYAQESTGTDDNSSSSGGSSGQQDSLTTTVLEFGLPLTVCLLLGAVALYCYMKPPSGKSSGDNESNSKLENLVGNSKAGHHTAGGGDVKSSSSSNNNTSVLAAGFNDSERESTGNPIVLVDGVNINIVESV